MGFLIRQLHIIEMMRSSKLTFSQQVGSGRDNPYDVLIDGVSHIVT